MCYSWRLNLYIPNRGAARRGVVVNLEKVVLKSIDYKNLEKVVLKSIDFKNLEKVVLKRFAPVAYTKGIMTWTRHMFSMKIPKDENNFLPWIQK